MLSKQLNTYEWLQIREEDRDKLVSKFKIPRSASVHVAGGKVVESGYTHQDLAHLSQVAMQKYTGLVSTDFYELLEATLNKLNAQPNVQQIKQQGKDSTENTGTTPTRHGRPRGSKTKAKTGKGTSVPVSSQA